MVGLNAQTLVQSGPWKFFRQEHPPLSYEEISSPFVVREISGIVSYSAGKPLEGAYFEIGLRDGTTLGTDTSSKGRFALRGFRFFGPFVRSAAISPGTYRFKLTKDGFHSAVGTVVVSPKAPKQSVIAIVLKPGDGYQEEQSKEAPDEQLIPLRDAIPIAAGTRHKKWPQKYSAVYMPVSLAVGRVRTPEFPVGKQWYDIMVQVEKPLPFMQLTCMMGVTAGPLDLKYCSTDDPLLRADWTVWDNGHIIQWGSIPNGCGCKFTDKYIFKSLGSFPAEAGEKYVVQVHFTKDGTPLDVANPHLIIIKHKDMWCKSKPGRALAAL
ncbi:MAG TPA: carboxypeptidase-like regulatory domain-containing protein [Terriglobales bacterium]|nr:carboxypeptidase-like regulatory domain-containing protein [Terriglobales bacterium]